MHNAADFYDFTSFAELSHVDEGRAVKGDACRFVVNRLQRMCRMEIRCAGVGGI
jgi:hypothetical protein